jgi:hypothetical protein
MDLLERYLQAIGQYLPVATRQDTLAELRANLLEQMDARAEELGRALGPRDVAAMLKAHGKPETVALRYLPQRSLIGPALYPFYMLTLSRLLVLVAFVSVLVKAIQLATSPAVAWGHALGGFALGLLSSLTITAVMITAVFAAIEWMGGRAKSAPRRSEWEPEKLPGVRSEVGAERPRTHARRVVDLVVHCLWFAYVVSIPWHAYWSFHWFGMEVIGFGSGLARMGLETAPVWWTFYAVLLTLLTVQLVVKIMAVTAVAQEWRERLTLVAQLLGVTAIAVLALTRTYVVATAATANLAKAMELNRSLALGFRVLLAVVAFKLLKDGWRYVKRSKPMHQMAF